MLFKKRSWKALTLASALTVALAACGGGEEAETDEVSEPNENGGTSEPAAEEETYSWDIVTEEYPGDVQYEYAVEFAELLKEKSDGRIDMTVFEYGTLGGSVDQIEQLQQGMIEFAVVSPGFTGGMVTAGQVFALQFLLPDDLAVTQEILNTSEALNTHLSELYEAESILPLAYWTEGAMQWTGDRELRTPADFEGFKIRTQESPLIMRSYEAYGADPTPMDWGELYTSLDRGTVEGQENPIFFIEGASFHEVQDHLTVSNHNNYVAMTTVNPTFYHELPEDIRAIVDETVAEMQERVFELQTELNDGALERIAEDTENPTAVIELTEEEREAFREKALEVREYFRNDVVDEKGREILELLEEEIAALQE
ncbi:TRAP transporter substrate-binding protein DctP [Bacillus solitudinis]|uniref:TRAP transporter substrate-binding protein DctP n=1 Tax=Bacillus solitudinis TaxID=2014074 RepID=UPI000C2441E8|nr:TRAP transporter substrate-binding protein DctP [Bacillus solitudinis]